MKMALGLLVALLLAGCESLCPQPYYVPCTPVQVSPCDRVRPVPIGPVPAPAAPAASVATDNP